MGRPFASTTSIIAVAKSTSALVSVENVLIPASSTPLPDPAPSLKLVSSALFLERLTLLFSMCSFVWCFPWQIKHLDADGHLSMECDLCKQFVHKRLLLQTYPRCFGDIAMNLKQRCSQ
ncbi:hypothetical protein TKK_0017855 [Trichogramma kaykai]